ncbi:MAG: AgmX/PglI C-terminal domain-containing protein [Deltaproteobacteria bacterium]|nr:AgmX/PglI C-terminal domain-containing protein [Deltaproteobacteria bacterium]
MHDISDNLNHQAVAVTTTLDSTVLDVEYLHRETTSKKRTWLPLVCGVVLALVAAFSFARGVTLADSNKQAHEAWIAADKPAGDFRPERMSTAFDLLAAFGLFGAVGCFGFMVWSRTQRRRSRLTCGSGDDVDIAIDSMAPTTFVEASDIGPIVTPIESMALSVIDDDGEHTEDEALAKGLIGPNGDGRLVLAKGARALFERGASRIMVESSNAPRSGTAAATLAIEGRAAQFLAGSALVHAGILALLWSLPPDASSLSVDSDLLNARLVPVRMHIYEEVKKDLDVGGGSETGDSNTTEELMSPPEGVTGEPDKTATVGRYTIEKRSDTPQLSRSAAIDRARRSGVLEFLEGGDRFGNIVHGTADFSSGFGERDVRGGLSGEVGAIGGTWGSWGVYNGVGTGPGYGTSKVGSFKWGNGNGICKPGEKCGYGPGNGPGFGPGNGPGWRPHAKGKPPTIGIPKVGPGGPDKAIIRRYIRRKLPRIRHCYEKQLLNNPSLAGTVNTQFLISPVGKVQGVRASGSGNAALDSCVGAAISSIQFPKFNRVVNVSNYPFTFKPAG